MGYSFLSSLFMTHDLSLDLKVARLKAGLTQADLAHLVGCHKNRICQIEKRNRPLSLREACTMSLALNRTFNELFSLEFEAALEELDLRLGELPVPEFDEAHTFNRLVTLSALAERVNVFNDSKHGR